MITAENPLNSAQHAFFALIFQYFMFALSLVVHILFYMIMLCINFINNSTVITLQQIKRMKKSLRHLICLKSKWEETKQKHTQSRAHSIELNGNV